MIADDPKALFLLKSWAHGAGVLPLVRHLISIGRDDEAAAIARLALRTADDDNDRVTLRTLLDECTHAPAGWADAIEAFAADPSEEAWDALLYFTPDEERFQRVKAMILVLMQLGCDGNALFRCASRIGFFPELFDLAQSGTVDPGLIEARANGSPSEPAWLGLAVQSPHRRRRRGPGR